MEERVLELESKVNTMIAMLNDLNDRVVLLTRVIVDRPIQKEVSDVEIIAYMEKEGVSWEDAKQLLMTEDNSEKSK